MNECTGSLTAASNAPLVRERDSLTAGLRALESLARHGPLDLARLARLNGWPVEQAAALMAVLEDDGWVRRLETRDGFVATPRAAAVVRGATGLVH